MTPNAFIYHHMAADSRNHCTVVHLSFLPPILTLMVYILLYIFKNCCATCLHRRSTWPSYVQVTMPVEMWSPWLNPFSFIGTVMLRTFLHVVFLHSTARRWPEINPQNPPLSL